MFGLGCQQVLCIESTLPFQLNWSVQQGESQSRSTSKNTSSNGVGIQVGCCDAPCALSKKQIPDYEIGHLPDHCPALVWVYKWSSNHSMPQWRTGTTAGTSSEDIYSLCHHCLIVTEAIHHVFFPVVSRIGSSCLNKIVRILAAFVHCRVNQWFTLQCTTPSSRGIWCQFDRWLPSFLPDTHPIPAYEKLPSAGGIPRAIDDAFPMNLAIFLPEILCTCARHLTYAYISSIFPRGILIVIFVKFIVKPKKLDLLTQCQGRFWMVYHKPKGFRSFITNSTWRWGSSFAVAIGRCH